MTFPAMHVMIAKWAPPNERSVLASIVYAGKNIILLSLFNRENIYWSSFLLGTALGTVISILLTGILAANFEWVWIFYIEGALCLIWCTVWWITIADSPEEQTKLISEEERNYIMQSLGQNRNEHKVRLILKRKFYDSIYIYNRFCFIILFRGYRFHGAQCYGLNHLWQF